MTDLNNTYTQRTEELHAAQQKLLRRMSYMTALEWTLVILFILFAGAAFNIYSGYSKIFWQLSPVIQISIGVVPLTIGIILISLAVFTDASRANTQQMLELSTLHYDVAVGVHEALDSYLGDTLPEYRKAMQGMDIGHELFQTARGYSTRLEKIIQLTASALETINLKGPLTDIKDLPAQARLVMQKAQSAIQTFEQFPEHSEIEELTERLSTLLSPQNVKNKEQVGFK
jgi:hypothetical protein